MRTSHWLLIATLGTLLGGCATTRTTQNLSDEDRKKISVVRINSNVRKPPNINSVVVGPPRTNALIQDLAEKNGIFIERIAFQEIDAAIRQSGKLNVSDSGEETAATINMMVVLYGFTQPPGFSSNLIPRLYIICEMVDATGKVIWRVHDDVGAGGNPVAPMSLEAMREDPKRIEDAWRKASRHIAINIAKTL